MTLLAPSPAVRIGPEGLPERTLGWQILQWTSDYLLQPDGPDAGGPWKFTPEQARFVLWWYAIDAQGKFVYRRGMLRRMKGWGKDPVGAALCAVEFVGPCRFGGWDKQGEPIAVPVHSAWVQTAAVAKEQTRNTMTLFPGTLSPRAIEEYGIDLGKEIIYAHHGRCRIEAVTSSPRALEGGRATFVLKNETHHWLENNEGHAMAAVIARNAAKISGRVLAISNAHNPGEDSDAERDWEAWQKIEQGRSRATGFLYDSVEAPPDTILSDAASLKAGLQAAAGDSYWVPIDNLIETIYDPRTAPSEARRFYLNQIVAAEDAWVAPHEWDALAAPDKKVEPGEEVTLGFDGGKTDDNTVLMACRVSDAHLFPLGIWDPEAYPDSDLPRDQIDAAVKRAFAVYDVVGFYSDVHPWESYVDAWEQEFGKVSGREGVCVAASTRHSIAWDMRGRTREVTQMAEAFHAAIVEGDLSHAGTNTELGRVMTQHVHNARRRPNQYGVTFSKEHRESARKVDAVAAGMLAFKARQDYLALPDSKKRRKKSGRALFA